MARKSRKVVPFSILRLLEKSVPVALNPNFLGILGTTLIISLLAFVGFSLLMFLLIGMGSILFIGGGSAYALFGLVFGLACWVLGMIGINTFVSGVQYHLTMQAVFRKPFDIDLAWKLSAARFRDAFIVQGSVLAVVLGIAFVSLLPTLLLLDAPSVLAAFSDPTEWLAHAPLTLLVLSILYLFLQPFLTLALPVAYFERAKPMEILHRVYRYVQPHYVGVLGTVIVLMFISGTFSTMADWITRVPLSQDTARGTAFAFVAVSAFSFLVQILVLLLVFALNLCAQTLLYLHIGNPQSQNHFTSDHPVAKMLSGMAREKPAHSPYLPVKWKTPSAPRGMGRRRD